MRITSRLVILVGCLVRLVATWLWVNTNVPKKRWATYQPRVDWSFLNVYYRATGFWLTNIVHLFSTLQGHDAIKSAWLQGPLLSRAFPPTAGPAAGVRHRPCLVRPNRRPGLLVVAGFQSIVALCFVATSGAGVGRQLWRSGQKGRPVASTMKQWDPPWKLWLTLGDPYETTISFT